MEVSAEIRWFWRGAGPRELKEWFTNPSVHTCRAGGGNLRTDAYLPDPEQADLGIKLRGNKTGVEVKGLVATLAEGCHNYPFIGQIEIWTKWSSGALSLGAGLVLINKRRWLRKFDCTGPEFREVALNLEELPIGRCRLPDEGCNVEYTEISGKGIRPWVSFGFEAFGTLDTVAACLRQTAARLSLLHPPALADGWIASYPTWLQRIATREQP
jgi:hypothetical protein